MAPMNAYASRFHDTVPELDLRTLPPPEPLLQALAAADALAPGAALRVLTPLLPLPLLQALSARGLSHQVLPHEGFGACVLIERTVHGATGD